MAKASIATNCYIHWQFNFVVDIANNITTHNAPSTYSLIAKMHSTATIFRTHKWPSNRYEHFNCIAKAQSIQSFVTETIYLLLTLCWQRYYRFLSLSVENLVMRRLIKLKQCKELTTVNMETNSFARKIKSHDVCEANATAQRWKKQNQQKMDSWLAWQ